MSKKKADKPAGKADKLKALKSPPVKAPLGGRLPKKKKTIEDHIEEATGKRSASTSKKLTTDELAEKLKRKLVIRYVAIDADNNFLIMNADDLDKNLPKEIEKDTFKVPVHKKFVNTIQKLRPHAAIMAGYIDPSKYKKISDIPAEAYAKFNVTSVHFKYPKGGDTIQINATLTTERKKAFNFTTPVEKLESESENAYEFPDDLLKIRANIFERIDCYMSGEERGDANAIGIFAEAEKTEAEILAGNEETDVTDRY